MKSFNNECQEYFLKAIGIEVSYSKAKIDWEKFIYLNCLLKLNTATTEEYIEFF